MTESHKVYRYLLVSEVAERLRCPVSEIERLCREGKLTFIESQPTLIDEVDLEAYVESLKRRPASRDSISEMEFVPPGESASARALRAWLKLEARREREAAKRRGLNDRE